MWFKGFRGLRELRVKGVLGGLGSLGGLGRVGFRIKGIGSGFFWIQIGICILESQLDKKVEHEMEILCCRGAWVFYCNLLGG